MKWTMDCSMKVIGVNRVDVHVYLVRGVLVSEGGDVVHRPTWGTIYFIYGPRGVHWHLVPRV